MRIDELYILELKKGDRENYLLLLYEETFITVE